MPLYARHRKLSTGIRIALTLPRGSCSVAANHSHGDARSMSGKKPIDLEKSLSALEAIVEELESGELPLEKAMQKFEQGIKLTRGCQSALKEAEQKVEILMKSAGGQDLVPFEDED